MSGVFAFGVAVPLVDRPAGDGPEEITVSGYDPDRQQLVWEGGGEAALGTPVCTGGRYSGRNPCRTTSTACYGTSCSTSSYPGCYGCDYG